jgi:hypothetical protein
MIKEISLNIATNRATKGPFIDYERNVLTIKYDFEEDDGSLAWGTVVFKEVILYKYSEWVCNTTEDLPEPGVMFSIDNSSWLAETLKRWDRMVGHQQYQKN